MTTPSPLTRCPGCDRWLHVVPTSYGVRAPCVPCKVRWTMIHGEDEWTRERL